MFAFTSPSTKVVVDMIRFSSLHLNLIISYYCGGSKKHDVVLAGAALRLKMAFSSTSPSITLGVEAIPPRASAAACHNRATSPSPCKHGWWRSPAATAMRRSLLKQRRRQLVTRRCAAMRRPLETLLLAKALTGILTLH